MLHGLSGMCTDKWGRHAWHSAQGLHPPGAPLGGVVQLKALLPVQPLKWEGILPPPPPLSQLNMHADKVLPLFSLFLWIFFLFLC